MGSGHKSNSGMQCCGNRPLLMFWRYGDGALRLGIGGKETPQLSIDLAPFFFKPRKGSHLGLKFTRKLRSFFIENISVSVTLSLGLIGYEAGR